MLIFNQASPAKILESIRSDAPRRPLLSNVAFWHQQRPPSLTRRPSPANIRGSIAGIELMLLLCAAYVFGCAFRSAQRMCSGSA
jgi:hypothetical protein